MAIVGYAPGRKIEDTALKVGNDAVIRAGSIIYGGSVIGENLETGHGAVIREENRIGDGLRIWNNSTIDYGCFIGNNVKIHCNVYIAQFTTIEDDVFLAPGVMVANDFHPLCSRCMKGPTIKKGARIGMNVTILPRVIIGEKSLIAAGAVVTGDVPPCSVVVGNPGRVTKSIYDLECKTGIMERPYNE
ncbi:MAG: N-acetyltransferase [Candidatus Eremiobacteraeota bacterium]|nr:N-acetyltransferase [Candidatus Eremiobacteraeota bacterium]